MSYSLDTLDYVALNIPGMYLSLTLEIVLNNVPQLNAPQSIFQRMSLKVSPKMSLK